MSTEPDSFQQCLHYQRGDFSDQETFNKLRETLAAMDQEHGTDENCLFYMATAPKCFCDIVQCLGQEGPARNVNGHWRRVITEKPCGQNLQSALVLNRNIKEVLGEKQLYRIDHYLGKETVQNIMVFRFGNGMFEPIWNVATSTTLPSRTRKPSESSFAAGTSMAPAHFATWWKPDGASSTRSSWRDLPPRYFPNHASGSWGPKEADHLLERDRRH